MHNKLTRVTALFLCLSILMLWPLKINAQELPFDLQSQSALLMDYDTGTILYEKNPHDKLPIASITKIMTTLLALEAIEEGRISLEDEVTVSEYAASMGGSQVFLEASERLPVSALLKAIIVASANDASVALAEKISGTVETFVKGMNEKAKELGMENTNFSDCTGLSDEGNYSTAYDISIMSRELLKYPLFFQWSTIWLDNLEESANNTMLTNTNRLVRFYDGCDGIKTGSTSKAKSCLAATAKRGNLRLISIVLAAPTSQLRFSEAAKLMDYGFANYDAVPLIKKDSVVERNIAVTGGKEKVISGLAASDFSLLQKKGEQSEYQVDNIIEQPIKAPIIKSQKIGYMTIKQNGKDIGTVDILADRDIDKAGIYDYFKQIIRNWASASYNKLEQKNE
ncbi:MAG: D-alanyl-D-alanine carboxypeptidase family protein [Caldicoprobacterales bacterium]|nr:D-alanyl-D-alanine carboxypeptidase [Clostridiales bacterium]